jgi:hypothetical protein
MSKYPEAASVVQQVHKFLSDIETLAECTPAKLGESSEWTTIVNSAENRANFCKVLDGKLLFSALYGMYAIALNELKTVLKVSAPAGQSRAVNKISLKPTAQDDDFQEVKRSKSYISNDTSQAAKKSTKSVAISTAVKLPPKAVLTRNFLHLSEIMTWTRELQEQRTH